MVKARTWFTLCIFSLGTIAATASCGSDEGTGNNNGGASGGGLIGNSGRGGGVGRAGAGGGSAAGTTLLGATCTADADCGAGLICFTSSTLPSGGPANGLCTKACPDANDCSDIPGASCFDFGTKAAPKPFCLASCTLGTPADDGVNEKCQGRGDMACSDFSDTDTPEAYCVPLCRDDLECDAGLFCDKKSGMCSKTKPSGLPAGSACTPAETDECMGFCIPTSPTGVTPATGVCAELCSGLLPCGYKGEVPGGLCAGPLTSPFGLYDLGLCLPNCSCSGDCTLPGYVCRAWASDEASIAQELGAPGLCYGNATDSKELTTCAPGTGTGAGGAGDGGAGGQPSVPPSAGAAGDVSTTPGAGGSSGAEN